MSKLHRKKSADIVDLIRMGSIVLSVIVVIAGAIFLLPGSTQFMDGIFEGEGVPVVDFSSLTIPESSPDHYLYCPQDVCLSQTPEQISKVYEFPADRLRSILLAFVDNQPTISFLRMNPAINQFDFKENDPTMRMPDVITAQIFDLEGGKSTIAIYSRSLHRFADKGSNRERVMRWLALMEPR